MFSPRGQDALIAHWPSRWQLIWAEEMKPCFTQVSKPHVQTVIAAIPALESEIPANAQPAMSEKSTVTLPVKRNSPFYGMDRALHPKPACGRVGQFDCGRVPDWQTGESGRMFARWPMLASQCRWLLSSRRMAA